MAKGRYEFHTDPESGIRFVFKRDLADPELLHIYARHLTTQEEAIATFFAAEPTWNEERRRFETRSDTHVLFWIWLERGIVVMIISCFRREDI
ncbi:MAG: hypothetical protein HY690_20270 [Chloroflexi bacterium]|nr:hypothetical protein [Chloroflexota bacterium]